MKVSQFKDNIYIFDDGKVREFLIIGETEAFLIDTGFSDTPLKEEIKKITDLPIKVILTHGDGDHIGGLNDFDECYFNVGDERLIQPRISYHYLKQGDILKIASYQFEVIEIPGHTYGSIALLEKDKRWLIIGDTVQKEGPIYMFGDRRNLDMYIDSLKKLQTYQMQIDWILPSHHDCPITPDYITYCLEDAIELKCGQLMSKPHPTMPCREYQGKYVNFYYD